MVIDIQGWLPRLVEQLTAALPGQVRFIGLQGSYRRGEATAESDIDIVTVLEEVTPEALGRYREAIRSLPHGELCCGFLCSPAELRRWPRWDLLSVALDTAPCYGSLEELLPAFTQADADEAVAAAASALYHGAVHTYLYADDPAEALPGFAKSVFFLLRARVYRDSGTFCLNKAELREQLQGDEAVLLSFCAAPEDILAREGCDALYGRLLRYSSALLKG